MLDKHFDVVAILFSSELSRPNRRKMMEKLIAGEPLIKTEVDNLSLLMISGSVGIKIQFAEKSLTKLRDIKNKMGPFYPSHGKIQLFAPVFRDFLKEFDSFIFELYSVLDVFSWEINMTLGPWIKDPRRIYFSRVKNELKSKLPNDEITLCVDQLWKADWFQYFHDIRTRITHRVGIDLTSITPGTEMYLPDEPYTFPSTVSQRKEVLKEAGIWLDNLSSFIDEVTGLLGVRLFVNW